jgi:hypothetical protein
MEMHTNTAVSPAAKRSPKARLLTVGHLDRRTRAAKRASAIAAELEAGFKGETTAVQRQSIGRAAVLCALAEDLGARRLAGQPIPLDHLLRAEGCAKRAVRAVLAECPVKRAPPREFLELRRLRWADQERAKKAQAKVKTEKAATNMESPDVAADE